MRWFKDHPRISVAIIALLVVLILFYISLLSVGKDNFFGKTLGVAVVQIQKPFSFIGSAVSEKIENIISANNAEKENEMLKEKISQLEQELSTAKLNKSELDELKQLSKAFDDHKIMSTFKPVAAEIVSYDGSNIFNIFTVNAGSDSGIKVNDAVINDKGLIGRVSSLGKNWSKVVAAIDESNNVGFQMAKNLRHRGVCQGNGSGDMTGYLFNTDAIVNDGDELITSGIGGIYPAGITIGSIKTIDDKNGNPLLNVTIKPSVNFKSIKKVAILTGNAE